MSRLELALAANDEAFREEAVLIIRALHSRLSSGEALAEAVAQMTAGLKFLKESDEQAIRLLTEIFAK